jgi:hypothetical protein
MNRLCFQNPWAAFLALALVLTGCTHTIKPPKQPFTNYAPQQKILLRVRLNITEELLEAKWERHSMGDTWVIPIGQSIADNSLVLAQHVFTEVVADPSQQAVQSSSDAILTPKVAFISRTQGATSFGESITSIKVEWTLTEPSGQTIWADTISGESTGSTGWSSPEKVLKRALEDLLTKSQQAMSSSEAIRQFTRK